MVNDKNNKKNNKILKQDSEKMKTNEAQKQTETKTLPIGLTTSEAEERKKQYGMNNLYVYSKTNDIELLASQFSYPILILILASILLSTVRLYEGILLISIISITIILNWRKSKETEEIIARNLHEFYGYTSAFRDGIIKKIRIEEVVPGDMLVLKKGMLIPADGVVIRANNCMVDERIFQTGIVEKLPESEVQKTFRPYKSDPSSLFAGSFVVEGDCVMKVTATGKDTKYYRGFGIKEILSTDPKRNDAVGRVKRATDSFTGVIYIASFVIIFQLILDGVPLFNVLVIAAAACVAAIPETVYVVASNIYASTLERVSNYIVIRKEGTIDKVGRTTIITSEIMRSLSRNEPTVRNIWIDRKLVEVTGDGWDTLGMFKGIEKYTSIDMLTEMVAASTDATLEFNNNRYVMDGDPIEGALVVMAMKNRMPVNTIRGEWARLETREENGITISKIRKANKTTYVMIGPVEQVVERCKSLYSNSKFLKIDEKIRQEIEDQQVKMNANGQTAYAIAFAWKRQEPKYFTLLSIVGIYDPPKKEVKETIQELSKAGINTIIITTAKIGEAVSFAREIGIIGTEKNKGKAMICDELKYLRPEERTKRILETNVFAESTNEYEAIILDTLKKEGHQITYVESTGIDYSPFLYTNVSLAVESAPDIIKFNADAIIKEDRYERIVDMIEESRDMRRNIERSFYALFMSDLSIFFTIIISSIIFTGDMITALQILLINLIADTAISTSFSKEQVYEKSLGYVTSKKFPDTNEYLFVLIVALFVSIYIGVLTTLNQMTGFEKSITIAGLITSIIAIILNSISIRDSILESVHHISRHTILSIAVVLAIALIIFYVPFISAIIGLNRLSLAQLIYLAPLLVGITVLFEIKKQLIKPEKK
jgi:Ca2+-transporting ATPase